MMTINYNPDVLSCLANLSNDEVFTPPKLVNEILDMLPQELFQSKETTFLDPVTKSGVFLREIAKRLNEGLKGQIPDQQERVNHIFTKQLYGIAITELTSLLARRSTYCTKKANGEYSVCTNFDSEQGNIKYDRLQHTWQNGKCTYCGASEEVYSRTDELETYAYQFIHTDKPQNIFNMKFDVIIGNPPYQLNNGGGSGSGASPIYHLFVEQARKLNPRYLTMIIPARWYTITGQPLKGFREEMLNDKCLTKIIDYPDANDCFPGVNINGGVCYFLWDRDNPKENCDFKSISKGIENSQERLLNEFDIFIRYNDCISIIHKVQAYNDENMSGKISSQTPFGFLTNQYGRETPVANSIKLHSSRGIGYVSRNEVLRHPQWIDKYKVVIGKAISGHAGVLDNNGQAKIIATIKILPPKEICTQTYLVVGPYETKEEAERVEAYLKTKFVRFLMMPQMLSISISRSTFQFVPDIGRDRMWNDDLLAEKYGLNDDEVAFIDSIIKEM